MHRRDNGMIEIREKDGGVSFAVRVQPRASHDEIAGEWQGALRVRLAAPPVDGKANEECVRFFAELARAPRSRVRIVTGLTSRTKVIDIEGVAQDQLERLMTG